MWKLTTKANWMRERRTGSRSIVVLRPVDIRLRNCSARDAEPIDTSSAAGKAFLDMLGVFAEFETNLRRERQMEGIAAAKLRGVYKGRPPSIDVAKVAALKAEGLGATEIAKRLEVGRASVYRVLAAPTAPSAPPPDAYTQALLSNPRFRVLPRSGKGFIIGGQKPSALLSRRCWRCEGASRNIRRSAVKRRGSIMSHKAIAILSLLTAVNVIVLVLNISPSARAAVAGASYKELINDADFTRAVKSVIETCRVNTDIARVICK